MIAGLKSLGVECEETRHGARIRGGAIRGGEVDSYGDHRVAMAFTILALVSDGPIVVRGVEAVDTSFPGFVDTVTQLGLSVEPVS